MLFYVLLTPECGKSLLTNHWKGSISRISLTPRLTFVPFINPVRELLPTVSIIDVGVLGNVSTPDIIEPYKRETIHVVYEQPYWIGGRKKKGKNKVYL